MLLAEAHALIPFLPSPLRGRGDGGEGAKDADGSTSLIPFTPTLSPQGRGETAAVFEPHDPDADRAALQKLAAACTSFSPRVAIDTWEPPDSLLLDITGCGYNFGGEEALAAHVLTMLRQRAYSATAAVANTIGAAWAVAHYGNAECGMRSAISSPSPLLSGRGGSGDTKPRSESSSLAGSFLEVLQPLPVEALRLSPQIIALLHNFDVRRIGQILELPRSQLPSRFGPELLLRLDQALGNIPELLLPERPAEIMEAAQVFEPPIADRQILEAVLEQLLEEILRRLTTWQLGVRRLHCALDLAAGEPLRFEVELLRPCLSRKHLAELLRLHVERLTVPAEIAGVALRAAVVAPLEFQQAQMFDDEDSPQRQREALALLERLSSRLGEKSVVRPQLEADAQPEFAYGYEPCLCLPFPPLRGRGDGGEGVRDLARHPHPPHPNPLPLKRGEREKRGCPLPQEERERVRTSPSAFRICSARPPSLLSQPIKVAVLSVFPGGPPLRFEWQEELYIVERYWGPERIETGWWRGDDIRRDYYLVETTAGERFWLFRTLPEEQWFLHGVFG